MSDVQEGTPSPPSRKKLTWDEMKVAMDKEKHKMYSKRYAKVHNLKTKRYQKEAALRKKLKKQKENQVEIIAEKKFWILPKTQKA